MDLPPSRPDPGRGPGAAPRPRIPMAAELNQGARQAESGDLGEDDWIVVDDREPPRVIT